MTWTFRSTRSLANWLGHWGLQKLNLRRSTKMVLDIKIFEPNTFSEPIVSWEVKRTFCHDFFQISSVSPLLLCNFGICKLWPQSLRRKILPSFSHYQWSCSWSLSNNSEQTKTKKPDEEWQCVKKAWLNQTYSYFSKLVCHIRGRP